jgi:CheY-like chemotaxis protein
MDILERIAKISDLNTSDHLKNMDEKQLEAYVKKLHDFVDHYPAKEREIKAALHSKDIEDLAVHIGNFQKILEEIYADDLAEECKKHIKNLKTQPFDRVSSYVTYLVSTLAALSIDIQVSIIVDENLHKADGEQSLNTVKTILAVDDDSFCLDTLKNALTDVTLNIICSTNGGTVLNMLRKYKPDLFILDIDMPGMDGLELAEKLRSLGHNQPIVFITGNADKNYVLKAINAGGADFIVKPINPQNVMGRIKKFL